MESTYLSWSPPGVHLESIRSPSGVYLESIRSLPGVHQEYQDFIRTPDGVHQDAWGSVTYREVSQFLEKNRDHNSTTNSENQISTGHKRSADKSVEYAVGDMQMATKEQQVDGNYEDVERVSSGLSEAADLVRCNTVIRIHQKI